MIGGSYNRKVPYEGVITVGSNNKEGLITGESYKKRVLQQGEGLIKRGSHNWDGCLIRRGSYNRSFVPARSSVTLCHR